MHWLKQWVREGLWVSLKWGVYFVLDKWRKGEFLVGNHCVWKEELVYDTMLSRTALSKHLCLRRGVKINEGFNLRHPEKLWACVCVYTSVRRHVFKRCRAVCINNPLTLFLSFSAHINMQPSVVCVDIHYVSGLYSPVASTSSRRPHVEAERVRSPHLAICMMNWGDGEFGAAEKNDLQGLLSLISIGGERAR